MHSSKAFWNEVLTCKFPVEVDKKIEHRHQPYGVWQPSHGTPICSPDLDGLKPLDANIIYQELSVDMTLTRGRFIQIKVIQHKTFSYCVSSLCWVNIAFTLNYLQWYSPDSHGILCCCFLCTIFMLVHRYK